MREIASLLNGMVRDGVITSYAVFGAIAQMRYTNPIATLDVDVLVALPDTSRLDLLSDVYAYCRARGYAPEAEAIRVGDWPLQVVPVFSALSLEALEQAETADFEGVSLRVVGAAHLAVLALSVGRGKDQARVLALLESGAVSADGVAVLAERHGLREPWQRFERRFLS